MAHLPPSYEDRCLRTWFVAPDVQNSRDNPMHFCSHSSAHLLDCTCKCGAVEGAAVTGTPRIEGRYESDGRGPNGNEYLRMGQSSNGRTG
jgi:hypothetical protein